MGWGWSSSDRVLGLVSISGSASWETTRKALRLATNGSIVRLNGGGGAEIKRGAKGGDGKGGILSAYSSFGFSLLKVNMA